MAKSLYCNGIVNAAYLEKDLGSDKSDVWVRIKIAINADSLNTYAGAASPYFLAVFGPDRSSFDGFIDGVHLASGSPPDWATGNGGASSETPSALTVVTVDFHQVASGTCKLFIDGVEKLSYADGGSQDVRHVRVGLNTGFGPSYSYASAVVVDEVSVGSTQGGSEFFSDTFEGGSPTGWTVTQGDVSVVTDPLSQSAPDPPTADSATVVGGDIEVAWTPAVDDGGMPVYRFSINRDTTPGGESLLDYSGPSPYTDVGAAATVYYYKVGAVNFIGESSLSNEVAPVTVPDAPTLDSVTASGLDIDLAWSAPSSDGGSAITGYNVYRGTASGSETLLTSLGVVLSHSDLGLDPGTTYYYKVSAVNAQGESALSNEHFDTTASAPDPPTLDTVTVDGADLVLNWTAGADNGSPITNYRIYRGASPGGETLLATVDADDGTSYRDENVGAGAFYYKVSAISAIGESSLSNEVAAGVTGAIVSAALGIVPGDFAELGTLATTGSAARRPFDLFDDNVQAVTVRIASAGPTSSFRVFSVEADVDVYGPGVTGGE